MPKRIRLLVVENGDFAATFIDSNSDNSTFSSITSVDSGPSAMKIFRQLRPNVCLIEIELIPGPSGIDVARAMRRVNSKVGIVFLVSVQDSSTTISGALPLPHGSIILIKENIISLQEISVAIQLSISKAASDEQSDLSILQKNLNLSSGQFELLRMISDGLSNREIANQRVTTIKSTENAISRLAKKLEIKDTGANSQRVLLAKRYFELAGKL